MCSSAPRAPSEDVKAAGPSPASASAVATASATAALGAPRLPRSRRGPGGLLFESIPQRRYTSRLETAIGAALLSDAVLRQQLVERRGLGVKALRASADRRTVFVQWACRPGLEDACEADLATHAFRLRRAVAASLQAKHTPRIEFRRDALAAHSEQVVHALRRAEEEDGGSASMHDAAAAAAAALLEGGMAPKTRRRERPPVGSNE